MTPSQLISLLAKYETYLIQKGEKNGEAYAGSTIKDYVGRVRRSFEKYPPADWTDTALVHHIDDLLRIYDFQDKNTASALRPLQEMLRGLPARPKLTPVTPSVKTSKRSKSRGTAKRTYKGAKGQTVGKLLLPCEMGYDPDVRPISYDSFIRPEDKVPGLASYLAKDYENIARCANDILGHIAKEKRLTNYTVRVVLSEETPLSDPIPVTTEYKREKLKRLLGPNGPGADDKTIDAILEEDEIRDRIVGRYCPNLNEAQEQEWETRQMLTEWMDEPHVEHVKIFIYYRNFTADTMEEYFAKAAMILAHEFMHFVHNLHVGMMEFIPHGKKESFNRKAVKEALADFFSMWYMLTPDALHPLDIGKKLALERYNLWEERRSLKWPYIYALYFFRTGGVEHWFTTDHKYYETENVLGKYRRVFGERLLKDAYLLLINE